MPGLRDLRYEMGANALPPGKCITFFRLELVRIKKYQKQLMVGGDSLSQC